LVVHVPPFVLEAKEFVTAHNWNWFVVPTTMPT